MATNNFTLTKFFRMLERDSPYHAQIATIDNKFICESDEWKQPSNPVTNMYVTPALFGRHERTKNSFKGANVLFCDVDDVTSTLEHLFVLKPTLKIRTSFKVGATGKQLSSYQLYWVLDETIHDWREYARLEKDIAFLLKGYVDKYALKPAQLLRLPYSIRHKHEDRQNENTASFVDVVYFNENLSYSVQDFETWRVLPKNIIRKITAKPKKHKNFSGGGNSGEFQVVLALLRAHATKRLVKSIFERSPIGSIYREKGDKHLEDIYEKAYEFYTNASVVEHNVISYNGGLHLDGEHKTIQLTDFVPIVKGTWIPYKNNTIPLLYNVSINGVEFYLTQADLTDKRKLVSALRSVQANVLCPPTYVAHIHKYIVAESNKLNVKFDYTNVSGMQEYKDQYTLVPSKKTMLQFNPANTSKLADTRLVLADGETDNRELVESFVALSDKLVTITMLGWFTATFFKEFLRQEELSLTFPMLMVAGGANTGKTTIITKLFNLFGLTDMSSVSLAGQQSDFVTTVALHLSRFPLYLKEYRANGTGNDKKSQTFRALYDGTATGRRGTSSQNVREYPLLRPVIFDGQDPFEEMALIGRSLTVTVLKKYRKPANLKKFNLLLKNTGFAKMFVDAVLNDLNRNTKDVIQLFYNVQTYVLTELKDLTLDDRSKSNLVILWFGLSYLYSLLKMPLPDVHLILKCYASMFDEKTNYQRNDATQLIEYILNGRATTQFSFSPEEKFLVFTLSPKVSSYRQMIKRSALPTTLVLSLTAYANLLNEHGLFIKPLGRGRYRIDIALAQKYGVG